MDKISVKREKKKKKKGLRNRNKGLAILSSDSWVLVGGASLVLAGFWMVREK